MDLNQPEKKIGSALGASRYHISMLKQNISTIKTRLENRDFKNAEAMQRAPSTIKNLEQQLERAIKQFKSENPNASL